ncbi:MAG: xylose isomerase [Thermobacillus sp. ZCTH02-B1]|uniref:sugar phosphate isomerase/epimerase family protein n=1 Tax=Thermobacillus sp. ZCTH02-B1 TaxID=1858795 RepID=UPI000B5810C8|nr:sugar phosphate isomerase/epimerase [Thermobacillus sp. ZCTH02-B1]OUM94265.1 MAG: xylose isomerase [Thermobacillus sp. ZCTH02-B1]
MTKPVVGIQLYTFRDVTKDDLLGTIRKTAEIGYQAVEFAGYFGHSAKEIRRVLDDCGLKAPSAHIPLNFAEPDKFESDLKAQIAFAQELGLEYVITPAAPFWEVTDEAGVESLIGMIDRASQLVTEAGLKYGYHNHDFEFRTVGGKPIIDRLLERIPAERLVAQFDLGWVHVGGQRPVEYLRRYKGRVPIVHFKDFVQGREDAEIGRGAVGYDTVLPAALDAGVEIIIVEQERFDKSPFESAAISLEFFRKHGLL